jgi:hypothetical protein
VGFAMEKTTAVMFLVHTEKGISDHEIFSKREIFDTSISGKQGGQMSLLINGPKCSRTHFFVRIDT